MLIGTYTVYCNGNYMKVSTAVPKNPRNFEVRINFRPEKLHKNVWKQAKYPFYGSTVGLELVCMLNYANHWSRYYANCIFTVSKCYLQQLLTPFRVTVFKWVFVEM